MSRVRTDPYAESVTETAAETKDTQEKDNQSLLSASKAGDLKLVRTLIDAGANVNSSSTIGTTPLAIAVKRKVLESKFWFAKKYDYVMIQNDTVVNGNTIARSVPIKYNANIKWGCI